MTAVDTRQTAFLHEVMPFARVLGVEALPAEDGEIRARVAWEPDRCTSGGALHGGVLMGLADVCGGACAFANLPGGATGTTTIESKTNFFRAVRDGYVEAISRPLHAGRTTIVVETDLFDAAGTRVARVTQTQAVLRG
ncbi:MAG TPA: PaaI family thioesterase [Acidimicrobiia bacterium]